MTASNRRRFLALLAVTTVLSLGAWALGDTTQPAPSAEAPEFVSAEGQPAEAPAQNDATTQDAQGEGKDGGQSSGGGGGLFGGGQWPLFAMLGGIVLLYIWMGRGRRKQEAKRKEMLSSLKKGDKITSIGGIVGTVIEVREDEVLVKVDETNNVRMRFARWAVRGVGEQAKAEKPGDRK